MEMEDPFASTPETHALHSVLSQHDQLPVNWDGSLTDDFLFDERYAGWSVGHRPWQLHCHGAAGCGKSTFALQVLNDLRQKHNDSNVRVAYIRVKQHVSTHHVSFIEDFLLYLYGQVSNQPAFSYENACQRGRAASERLKLIRTALHKQLAENEHSFLIFDGYDKLDSAASLLVDQELLHKDMVNISVLMTRRSPSYCPPERYRISCDGDGCNRTELTFYWTCHICGDAGPFYCYDCKEGGSSCTDRRHQFTLSEPYDRIELDMNSGSGGPGSAMMGFITRQLKGYTSLNDDTITEIAFDISKRAGGNVNLAQLRMDDLLSLTHVEQSKRLKDRLPRSIVAFFDSQINEIARTNDIDRDLGLMAIAAVAQSTDAKGMKVSDLARSLRQANQSPFEKYSTRSLEDILTCTNGLLVLQPYQNITYVACFNTDMFLPYVREDYNELLYLAKSRTMSLEGLTFAKPGQSWDIAPKTTSPPTLSEDFDARDYINARSSSQDSAYFSRSTTLTTASKTTSISRDSEPRGLLERGSTLPIQSTVTETPSTTSQSSDLLKGICAFCQQQILQGNELSGIHHTSIGAIQDSLANQCAFCSELYANLSDTGDASPDRDPLQDCQTKPLPRRYSWSIRNTGRSTNSEPSFVITFSPEINMKHDHLQRPRKYHVLSESDIGHVPSADALSPCTVPQSPHTGLQIREWLEKCANNHASCNKSRKENFIPTRLVDVEIGNTTMVRVVPKKNIQGPYLTLSHSWGPPNFLQLKKHNEDILMGKGVEISELTINFQQAIAVARFIGIRYIWIDSLCIMQGPDGDFRSEGQLMHKVYAFSHCNIAIADSENSTGGLFRMRRPANILPGSISSDGRGKLPRGNWRVVRNELWEEDLLSTKIYTRGWVFQERLLAPRILHFAADQIFWDCGTLSACETLPDGLPHALDAVAAIDRHWRGRMQLSSELQEYFQPLVGTNDDSIESFWRSAVLNYTSCNLTNQGDKSVAIWSIAKLVRDELQEEYGGGLWQNALAEQLAWRMRDVAPENEGRIPELQFRYPSWSWASVKGPVIAHDRLPMPRHYVVTDHQGKSIAFKSAASSKDQEPTLEKIPMAMCGYIGQGLLSHAEVKDAPSLHISGIHPEDTSSVFEVFLDEFVPTDEGQHRLAFEFIILAASASPPVGSRPAFSSRPSNSSNTSDSRLEDTSSEDLVHSGIALLLTPLATYKGLQNDAFRALLQEVVKRSPHKSWPDPDYGKGKSLVDRTADMRQLSAKLRGALQLINGNEADGLYRRIGAIEFRDVEQHVWDKIVEGGLKKIWLD